MVIFLKKVSDRDEGISSFFCLSHEIDPVHDHKGIEWKHVVVFGIARSCAGFAFVLGSVVECCFETDIQEVFRIHLVYNNWAGIYGTVHVHVAVQQSRPAFDIFVLVVEDLGYGKIIPCPEMFEIRQARRAWKLNHELMRARSQILLRNPQQWGGVVDDADFWKRREASAFYTVVILEAIGKEDFIWYGTSVVYE